MDETIHKQEVELTHNLATAGPAFGFDAQQMKYIRGLVKMAMLIGEMRGMREMNETVKRVCSSTSVSD